MSADQVADVFGTLASAGLLAILVVTVMRALAPARFAELSASLRGSGSALAGAVATPRAPATPGPPKGR